MEFKIYSIFYDNKKDTLKKLKVNEIYQLMILELLKLTKLQNEPISIYIDKFLPTVLEKEFISKINKFLKSKNSNVFCVHSETNHGVQFADLVSWSTFQYLEKTVQHL